MSSLVTYFVITSQKKWSVCNSDVDHRLLLRAVHFSVLPSASPQFLETSGTDSVLYYIFSPHVAVAPPRPPVGTGLLIIDAT